MTTREHLGRLGIDEPLPPTLDSLRLLHARHLEHVPYENLATMLGRPPSVDPASCQERVAATGRAGYCFHQNAALERLLTALGYAVERRAGHVWHHEGDRWTARLNHLALVVGDLDTEDNPAGRWWVDVGLGDGFRHPLPLVPGEHVQDGFCYRITEVRENGWSLLHDPHGTWTGIEVGDGPVGPADVLAAHAELSTPPEGPFTRVLVAQRRDATGVDSLRCCVLRRVEPDEVAETDLTAYDDWRGALGDVLRVPLDDVAEDDLRDLHGRMLAAHREWEAAGRP